MEWDLGFLGLATLSVWRWASGCSQLWAGKATSRWLWVQNLVVAR
jgi:hypothetical protein